MKLVATMPVRNEAWVLGLSARVALLWCDALCVLNHASTDATVDILAELEHEYPGRVHVVSMPDDQWTEMQHRQCLLEMARMKGATHIAIVDADEILTGNLAMLKGDQLANMRMRNETVWGGHNGNILQLPGYNMRGSIDRFHVNGIWGHRWFSVAFKDDPRLHWTGDQFHHREPFGMDLAGYRPIRQRDGGIMHLWGVTERRLLARHVLYKITEALRWPEKSRGEIDRMYSFCVNGNPPHDMPKNWTYQQAPAEWWAPYAHLMKYLDLEAAPWQESEARRLYVKHGAEAFRGLDLFDVV